MKIIFMGSPVFSVPTLQALHKDHNIVGVYAQPPRPAGRGKKLVLTPVHQTANELGLPVYTPVNFKNNEDINTFIKLKADIAVVVAYGLILPEEILTAPRLGCLNIHASLLPRWRGAAPIHRAVMAGDTKTGVCIMKMDRGLDTGPVYTRREISIDPMQTTTPVLHDHLSTAGADLILETIASLAHLEPVVQSTHGVTYARKITKDEACIDWTQSATHVDRQIRALGPFPGAWTLFNGKRLKILEARLGSDTFAGDSGTVLNNSFAIGCGKGVLQPVLVQLAGKNIMSVEAFLRGTGESVKTGMRLGK